MNKVITFVFGAAVGSLLTWKYVETKYKRIADEEIESVIETFKNKKDNNKEEEQKVEVDEFAEDRQMYELIKKDMGYSYTDYTGITDQEENEEEPQDDMVEPYTINPEEYGEEVEYERKSWTYYADAILADEMDEIVCDPENIIGDGLSHFGEFEDDSVYVRNENLQWDIEILKHEKTFSEVTGENN